MIKRYLNTHAPKLTKELCNYSPSKVREFVSYFKVNPSALNHFNCSQLVENPDLWLVGTEEAKKREKWLQEEYPSHQTQKKDIKESILVCGNCDQRKVDYYQKQTRGADEPMTCFCECLHCGKRWVQ